MKANDVATTATAAQTNETDLKSAYHGFLAADSAMAKAQAGRQLIRLIFSEEAIAEGATL